MIAAGMPTSRNSPDQDRRSSAARSHSHTSVLQDSNAAFSSDVPAASLRWTRLSAVLLVLITICSGCRSLIPSHNEGIFANRDFFSSDQFRQPLEGLFSPNNNALQEGQKFSEEGQRQVDMARQQFDDGQYPAAINSYKRIARKYKGSSIGEEAWFRIGESYYAMGVYPEAQDAYDKLFADYPSTKYVSDTSRRMFSIAKAWLEVADPVTHNKIKTVSDSKVTEATDPNAKSEGGLSAKYRLIPNFFDKSRPLLDTPGRAQNALRSIWLNDPTGPLADDALMLTASYYLQRGNYIEADRYLENLRDLYPDSPHLEQAYALGGHVKQMSYQGPMYDDTSLVAAENLKQRSLTLFPNSADRQQIQKDLGRLYFAKARDAFEKVVYYQKKNNPRSIAIECKAIIEEYPDTPYADRARAIVRQIPVAAVQNLPGMADFVQSIRETGPANNSAPAPPSNDGPDDQPTGKRVKSVSEPSSSRNPFRLLGL